MNRFLRDMILAGILGILPLTGPPGNASATSYTFTTVPTSPIPDPFSVSSPFLNGTTVIRGINDSGQIVGIADGVRVHGHFGSVGLIGSPPYSGGSFTALDGPQCCFNSHFTTLNGINNVGQSVGAAGYGPGSAFLYSGGTFTSIGGGARTANGINNRGQIVGTADFGFGGYLDTAGTFTHISDPLATNGTDPMGINNIGRIVGVYYDSSGIAHGFFDTNNLHPIFTPINDPLATNGTFANGINDRGQIVGYYDNASGTHGFIDNGGVFSTINDPLATNATWVYGINNRGQIVGGYGDGVNTNGFIASPSPLEPTPEPSTCLMFGTGLVLMGIMALRKRKVLVDQ